MNSLWDIRIFLGLVPKESPCISVVYKMFSTVITREICDVRWFRSSELLTHISALNRGLATTYLNFFCISCLLFFLITTSERERSISYLNTLHLWHKEALNPKDVPGKDLLMRNWSSFEDSCNLGCDSCLLVNCYCVWKQVTKSLFCFDCLTLKMEELRSSETSVTIHQCTRCNSSDDLKPEHCFERPNIMVGWDSVTVESWQLMHCSSPG